MFQPDLAMPWTEHYVEYGFALLPGLVRREVCAEGLDDVRTAVEDDRPLDEWTVDRPGQRYTVYYEGERAALDRACEEPALIDALAELFGEHGMTLGSTDGDDPDRRHFTLWLNPYSPHAKPRIDPIGHIDS